MNTKESGKTIVELQPYNLSNDQRLQVRKITGIIIGLEGEVLSSSLQKMRYEKRPAYQGAYKLPSGKIAINSKVEMCAPPLSRGSFMESGWTYHIYLLEADFSEVRKIGTIYENVTYVDSYRGRQVHVKDDLISISFVEGKLRFNFFKKIFHLETAKRVIRYFVGPLGSELALVVDESRKPDLVERYEELAVD